MGTILHCFLKEVNTSSGNKINKSGLGGNDFHISGGKNSKRGVGGIMFESRRETYQPRAGACMALGARGLYVVPSAMGSR